MASISSRVSALYSKIQDLAQLGTDKALRRVWTACIFIAMDDLGNAAVSSSRPRTTKTRKSLAPISTWKFVFDNDDDDEKLGEGPHAYVTKVRHRTTGKTFAMKTLFEDEEEEVANLHVLREACLMVACRGHPSVVRLHAVCTEPVTDRYCLLMEQVGPTLCEVMAHQRHGASFVEHYVRRVMRQVLSGAKAMHDRGIVHRNIHSQNVLVAAGGDVVKIGGFGQATCVSQRVECQIEMWDKAPEVLLLGEGALESELLDSWLIGCLMAELLTGEVLFMVNDRENNTRETQLRNIFDVLSVPGKRAVHEMKPRDLELAQQVQEWRAQRGAGKPQTNNYRLRELVPPEVLSDDGFRVLRGLLTCNPKRRLTAGAALRLPWFAHNDDDSPAAEVSQQVRAPVSRPWPFTWLLVIVLVLLCLVVFVCVGSR
ncbi:hypothetical protein QOZ80_5AG0371550 [Eleusine coracana subsp. coracana]|nr:hypothetical protein QOZ80_5AG0371550 [Eleusine coracana subsp. coracana]